MGWMFSFQVVFQVPSDVFSGMESLGHKAVPFLIFFETSILFSTVAAPVCIQTNSAPGFPFFHIFPTLIVCCLIDDTGFFLNVFKKLRYS